MMNLLEHLPALLDNDNYLASSADRARTGTCAVASDGVRYRPIPSPL